MARDEREKQLDDIGDRIASGIAKGMESIAPPKRIRPGSSAFDPHSPFRSKKGPKLRGELYDNGIRLNEDQLYDSEIELANQITVPGRYVDRIVEVRISDDAGNRIVLISYPDKGVNQRMENKSRWRNWGELLEKIVNEQNQIVAA